LCEACDSEWQGQVWVQEQLGLSPEQWNRPGVGDQIMDALRRAECQQGGEWQETTEAEAETVTAGVPF
jgi:hypothetical protein